MIEIESASNQDGGVYASDPQATFESRGPTVPISFSTGVATIAIPAAVWELVLIELNGASADGVTDPGIVSDTTSDYVITIGTATRGPGSDRSWTSELISSNGALKNLAVEEMKT